MFTPHVTVACVVQAQKHFLIVEEWVKQQLTWNQPAGHLEAGESIIQAAERELWEETGLQCTPQALLAIFQWVAPDQQTFLRFTFTIDLPTILPVSSQDKDISNCIWLPAQTILEATNLRSPLVKESILHYLQPPRYPLPILVPYSS